MKPYYSESGITIYHGDCREILPTLPKVDLVLTDPPYGLGIDKALFKAADTQYGRAAAPKRNYGSTDWDKKPGNEIFEIIRAHSTHQIIFGGNYFTDILPPSKCWVTWDKKLLDQCSNDFADCELAWCSFDKPARMIRFMWSGMLQNNMKEKEERLHPTQKPVPVIQKLLEWFSLGSDVVLDPFMGSGTTLRAAKDLGRKAIGIEIEEKYCEIAVKRLAQEVLPI